MCFGMCFDFWAFGFLFSSVFDECMKMLMKTGSEDEEMFKKLGAHLK